eukprot:m.12325 g.12325  ORF g.12325 m.12325 type:complete len:109 (+) comp17407_c0_seq1:207-533(+)
MPAHVPRLQRTGNLAVGLQKGFKTTLIPKTTRPSQRKGKQNARVKMIRDVIREVAGFAPYEKRAMELLRVDKDKRALKFIKARLGTHTRGKRKREEIREVISAQRKHR